jgi:hypothetical protein
MPHVRAYGLKYESDYSSCTLEESSIVTVPQISWLYPLPMADVASLCFFVMTESMVDLIVMSPQVLQPPAVPIAAANWQLAVATTTPPEIRILPQ